MVRLFPKKFIYIFILFIILSPVFISFLSFNFSKPREYYTTEKPRISNIYGDINSSFLPDIDYTSLNDLWYNPKIEMLIITP
ncbi:MAG: hypothetical protein ACFFA7_14750, partial [Promethearchaeota archaeon]